MALSNVNQYIATFIISFGTLIAGSVMAWPSYTLKLFESAQSPLERHLSDTERGLIGSLPAIGALVGTPLGTVLIDVFGRKRGGLMTGLPFLLSWTILLVTKQIPLILTARLIGGLSHGACLVITPTYICEIAVDSIRGTLAAIPTVTYVIGVLISYLLGWLLKYDIIALIHFGMSLLFITGMTFIKESPYFLLKNRNEKGALDSLAFYRSGKSNSKHLQSELSHIKSTIHKCSVKLTSVNTDVTHRPTRRAFIICCVIISCQANMGMTPIQVHAKEIFQLLTPDYQADICASMFAVVLTIGCIGAALGADIAGRRLLLILSCMMCCVCNMLLGLMLQYQWIVSWLGAVILYTYCFMFCFGAGTISFVLLAELFEPELSSVASLLSLMVLWLQNSATLSMYEIAKKLFGICGIFYMFSIISVVGLIFTMFIIPETKGLSQEEIQEKLQRNKL